MSYQPTERSVEDIERAYGMRLSHARSIYQMAVTAAESRLQHALEQAAEIRQGELNDLAKYGYTPPLEGLLAPYGVTKLAGLPESARRTRIEG